MSAPVDLLFEGIGRGVSALAEGVDPDLPELLRESEGRRLALVVRGSGRCLEIEVRDGALRVLPPRRVREEEHEAGREAGAEAPREEGAGASPAAEPVRPEAGAPPAGGEDEAVADPVHREAGAAADGEEAGGPTAVGGWRQDPPASRASRADWTDQADGAGGPAAAGRADLVLTGSVPDFLRLFGAVRREPPPEDPFGRIEAHGSPEARAGFVQLLRRIEPDYEALLARAAGGVVAHAVSRTVVGRVLQARRTAARLVDDLAEYLEEEARVVPDPSARSRFTGGVRALIDKAAELEERLDRVR